MNNRNNKVCVLYSQPYLDNITKEYKNIISINNYPSGPLNDIVKTVRTNKLSSFSTDDNICILALTSLIKNNSHNIMTEDEIPELISYLTINNYIIDSILTHSMNTNFNKINNKKIIFYIKHNN